MYTQSLHSKLLVAFGAILIFLLFISPQKKNEVDLQAKSSIHTAGENTDL